MQDGWRVALRGLLYAAGSIGIAGLILLEVSGALAPVIAGIILCQGLFWLLYAFVANFWARYEAFATTQDWAAGHYGNMRPEATKRRSQGAGV
jgi:hypothetical protein